MAKGTKTHPVSEPISGLTVQDVFALEPAGNSRGHLLCLYTPTNSRPEFSHSVDSQTLEFITQGLRGWLTAYAPDPATGLAFPPYLDVRNALELDPSPPGLVQPSRFGISQGRTALAFHHFNGPWPLLRLIATTGKPARTRVFVTMGVPQARDLHHLMATWTAANAPKA